MFLTHGSRFSRKRIRIRNCICNAIAVLLRLFFVNHLVLFFCKSDCVNSELAEHFAVDSKVIKRRSALDWKSLWFSYTQPPKSARNEVLTESYHQFHNRISTVYFRKPNLQNSKINFRNSNPNSKTLIPNVKTLILKTLDRFGNFSFLKTFYF